MAVMTHAQNLQYSLPIAGDYTAMTRPQKDAFAAYMDKADNAATGHLYQEAMVNAALTAGIVVPDSQDIALCDCLNDGCGCGAIFDSHTDGVIVTATADPGFNLSRLQCPDCSHDHPRPAGD